MLHRMQVRARADQHFAYSGRWILATDVDGWINGLQNQGLYYKNTRLLSRDELLIKGKRPTPICTTPVGGDSLISYGTFGEEHSLPADSVYVEAARFVGEGLRTQLRLTNYSRDRYLTFELALALAADFADMMETEQGRRQQDAGVETRWDEHQRRLEFHYSHPQLSRTAIIRIVNAPGPVGWEAGMLTTRISLKPRHSVDWEIALEPIFDGEHQAPPERRGFSEGAAAVARLSARLGAEAPRLRSSNATVTKAWETAIGDLASLPFGAAEGMALPTAGIPLYQQLFGRDSLTIGWQALLAMKRPLADALRANAAWIGTRIDDWYDEEPGKMLHQRREGPLSALGVDPFLRYYGDFATVPDFLAMLPQYVFWSGDLETGRQLLPAARAGLQWLDRYADLDRDGFIEYRCRSPKGVKNQGWKDSDEAIISERGEIVENPIAASELQGYWYAGLQQMAFLYTFLGDVGGARHLWRQADELKRRFHPRFWMAEQRFYAMALGPDGGQIRSIASNAAHLLATGIVPPRIGRRVAERLMADDMFSGWGIRTLSAHHPAFNPFSYHLGSVWPVENATAALGFARYGRMDQLHRLAKGVFDTTEVFANHRLPEAVGGLQRDDLHPHPGIYAASNEPQGWSASGIVMIVQALLGMRPVAPLGLLLVDPHLPEWLPDLRLDGIVVGGAVVDVWAWRTSSGRTRYRSKVRTGSLRVVRQPPPDATSTNLLRRAAALAGV